ncbi:hypothetical protein HGM15179_014498 [Zosterops borbonicus]|uniref:Uncharacterized protein n=1 Tax=Zosterops borbonicus TaxID=364589 RepID=A0A8K1G6Y9_9PASS|nr:hypothetical protein HGM15179_014498 [Zosterops borbonicus]
MPAKSCRSLVDKKENGMQIDFTSPKCENLVIKWSNKQDVAHNALKTDGGKAILEGVVRDWNSLPTEVVDCGLSLEVFKRHLGLVMWFGALWVTGVVLREQLDWVIVEVFSNLDNSPSL